MKNNPFFIEYNQPFDSLPFNEFRTEHFLPAIHEAIKISNTKIDTISNCNEEASFDNTILELEIAHEDLQRIVGVYWHLFGAHSEGDFKKLGIIIKKDYTKILAGVNSQRLNNNPITICRSDLLDILFKKNFS